MAAVANAQYFHDDGGNEGSIGLLDGGAITWANEFMSVAGCEVITSIDIAWGRSAGSGFMVPDGTSVFVQLWSGPNNDGNPIDAFLLKSVLGTTLNLGNSFSTYDIDDTLITPGRRFFVGTTITHASGEFPASWDSTTPQGRSWIAIGGNFAGGAYNLSSLGLPGNWMIRANCEAVPEPASMAALGLGAAALVCRRRRKKA